MKWRTVLLLFLFCFIFKDVGPGVCFIVNRQEPNKWGKLNIYKREQIREPSL